MAYPMILMVPVHYPHPILYYHHPSYLAPFLILYNQQKIPKYHNERSMVMQSTCELSPNKILKLNTDGSSKGNPGPSSFGGLIRDGEGKWLCGYMGKMKGRSYTSLEAEVWGVYKGLCLIKNMNLSSMLIETDCETILRISCGSLDKDHPLRSIMDAIDAMLLETKCALTHTRRNGNHCADQLAKLGGKQLEEYVVLRKPPKMLIPYLLRDEIRFGK